MRGDTLEDKGKWCPISGSKCRKDCALLVETTYELIVKEPPKFYSCGLAFFDEDHISATCFFAPQKREETSNG